MLSHTPQKQHHSQSNSSFRKRPSCNTLQVESLEDRTVPSQLLTVGTGREYPTITAALSAASANATIEVYPGTYNEAVQITQNGIQLIAVLPTAVIQPTSVNPVTLSGTDVGGAAIDIYATKVLVQGFTVDGSLDTDTNLWAGIRVIEGGSATITNNTVKGMLNGSPNTDVGIQVGTSLVSGNSGTGTASVTGNNVFNYAGAGIMVDGSTASANIAHNTITGRGTANGGIYEYGVQVSNGALASVVGNLIRGNTIDGSIGAPNNPTTTSAGIFFFNENGVSSAAYSNTLSGNDDGIVVQSSNGSSLGSVQIISNAIQQSYGYAGIFVLSSSNVQIITNNISNNIAFNGIALNSSSNTMVFQNISINNGTATSQTDGIYDLSGTNNHFGANASSGNTGNGINIQSSSNDDLFDNTTRRNTLNGIQDLDGTNDTVWFGLSTNNKQDGIVFNNTSGDTLYGNVEQSNSGYGLHLKSAANTDLISNLAVGNSTGTTLIDPASTGTVVVTKPAPLSLGKPGILNLYRSGYTFYSFYV